MDYETELAEILLKAIEGIPHGKQVELIASTLEGEQNRGYYIRDNHYRLSQTTKFLGSDLPIIKTLERCKPVEGQIQG